MSVVSLCVRSTNAIKLQNHSCLTIYHNVHGMQWEQTFPSRKLRVFDCGRLAKFPVVKKFTGSTTSAAVVSMSKQIYSEYGIPEKVISVNGPKYASEEYHRFAEDLQFDHVTSSPRFPQSNRFIERMIQTVKAMLKKTHESAIDPYLALLSLSTTPVDNTFPSPGDLLSNR